jgi:hypothetical protein
MVSQLLEILSGLFIPDPDPDFLPIPDPGVKKAPDPGSGSATMHPTSVGDPDLKDPHVFGPPGSGPISQRYGSGSGSFPFPIKVLSGLK